MFRWRWERVIEGSLVRTEDNVEQCRVALIAVSSFNSASPASAFVCCSSNSV